MRLLIIIATAVVVLAACAKSFMQNSRGSGAGLTTINIIMPDRSKFAETQALRDGLNGVELSVTPIGDATACTSIDRKVLPWATNAPLTIPEAKLNQGCSYTVHLDIGDLKSAATLQMIYFSGQTEVAADHIANKEAVEVKIKVSLTQLGQDSGYANVREDPDETNSKVSRQGQLVIFEIPAGTGNKFWNSKSSMVRVKVGETLRLVNRDSVQHTLHTNGSPCPHGDVMAPNGGYYDCKIATPYDPKVSGPLYAHEVGHTAEFWLEAIASDEVITDTATTSSNTKFNFAKDISPILKNSCSPCHESGGQLPLFVGSESETRRHKDAILSAIQANSYGRSRMPPPNSNRFLSTEAASTLRSYLTSVAN